MPPSLHQNLNPAQLQAVHVVDGPLLVLAGPGSGKTAVITHRIAHLIEQGIDSHRIVALTFTNKAADEMKSRVMRMVDSHQVWIGTFHRFCSRLLRVHAPAVGLQENFTIYDKSDSRAALKEACAAAEIDPKYPGLDRIAELIARAKHNAVDVDSYRPIPGNSTDAIVARAYRAYANLLRGANAVDFDDLLLHTFVLLRDNPELRKKLDHRYRYILVDEYQDTNATQYAIVRGMSIDYPNLCVTGDPDQSIYGWRGANLDNILRFEKDFPTTQIVRLEQNYRSTPAILRAADQLIQNNVRRMSKSLRTDNPEGPAVRLVSFPTTQQEATDIVDAIEAAIRHNGRSPQDFAVLYRANWLSRSFEHELRSRQIPYVVVQGHEFYQRKEIKDLFAYLNLINNPLDNVAIARIINVPPRKIGKATLDKLRLDAAQHRDSILAAARRSGLIETISKQAAAKVAAFVALYDRLCELRHESSVRQIIESIVEILGYREYLVEGGDEEGENRAANVDELIAAAEEFDMQHPEDGGLEAYLESASLVNDIDDWDGDTNAVSLMTLHASKGLEFPVVFIVGLEEGLLPHERSAHSDEELEEERRLLFVGMTRSEQELQLSRTLTRFRRGQLWPTIASRFLMELPRDQMEVFGPTSYEFYGQDRQSDLGDVAPEDDFDWETGEFVDPPESVSESPSRSKYQRSETARDAKPSAKIMTAAQMLAPVESDSESPKPQRVPVEMFQAGMLVTHPEYGAGVIASLSGAGSKCVATVTFANQERSFRLAHSPLIPIGRKK